MPDFIIFVAVAIYILWNFLALCAIPTYGLNHFYESFTYDGCSKVHYNANVFGCILLLILAYVFMLPCAIIFWTCRLFLRPDYF